MKSADDNKKSWVTVRAKRTEFEFATFNEVSIKGLVCQWTEQLGIFTLDQRVASLNPGRVIVFTILSKMLNLDCLSPFRSINGTCDGSA